MKTVEDWFLKVADSDWTWIGFNWVRPRREQQVGAGRILISSFVLGLPGIFVGALLIYLALGRVGWGAWALMFAAVFVVESFLHVVFAVIWNRRASRLAGELGL